MSLAIKPIMRQINPTQTDAWKRLKDLSEKYKNLSISELFLEPERFERFSISLEDTLVDYSKNRLNKEIFDTLLDLARECELHKAIESMFTGEAINGTEGRAVLHTALRNQKR